MTLTQLRKILETECPKYPITIKMKGIDQQELKQLIRTLKTKKKS